MQHAHFPAAMKRTLHCIIVLVAVLLLAQTASGGGFGNKRGGKVSRESGYRHNAVYRSHMQRARATQGTSTFPFPPTNPLQPAGALYPQMQRLATMMAMTMTMMTTTHLKLKVN